MSRLCAKPGCDSRATATLSYAYAESTVWLDELAAEDHPMVHDLCDLHADTVRVPRGWELRDLRSLGPGPSSLDLIGA